MKIGTRRTNWPRIASTERLAGLALIAALAVSLASAPAQVDFVSRHVWPVTRLWPDLDAQYRLQLGEVAYDALTRANELLPREAGVLLVTPGVDVRHLDYTTFHRALYFLAPRPVWWLTPASPDGTWEARWWISKPATSEQILEVANEKGVDCILLMNLPEVKLPGQVAQLGGASLATVPGRPLCVAPNPAAAPSRPAGIRQAAEALAALTGVVLFGMALVTLGLRRAGYRPTGTELILLGWPAGAAIVTTSMLWLGAAGIGLRIQLGVVSVMAALSVAAAIYAHPPRWRPRLPAAFAGASWEALALLGLVLLIGLQLAALIVTAVGRPLEAWDSWVNWAMKARVIFAGDGLGPALFADASRVVTHLDYPLFLPLLQAWIFAWVGAPDDRLAALPVIFFYLLMIAAMYAGARRWGARPAIAALPAAVLACMPGLASVAALGFADLVVAALVTLAAIYLVDWLRTGGAPGPLLVASLAAGLLPWTKREGWILLAAFALAVVVAEIMALRRYRPALASAAIFLAGAVFLAGPWLVFTLVHKIPNPDYGPLNVETLAANAGRLRFIVQQTLLAWTSPQVGRVWPAALLVAAWEGLRSGPLKIRVWPADVLLLGPGLLYLAVVALVYVVSVYVPYEQHVFSSVSRLAAQVAPLPIIWLVVRMHPQVFADARA